MGTTKKFVHLIGSIVSLTIVFVIFTTPLLGLPPLGDFLDPTGGGVFDVAQNAEIPSYQEVVIPDEMLQGDVTVYRDEFGIPHIYAEKDADMHFALGYLQAQDRLFQMDIQRRLFSGTVSEVVGSAALDNDIFMRSVGLVRVSEDIWNYVQEEDDLISTKMVEAAIAYSNGVNYFINTTNNLPFEFQLLGYQPTPWTPVDSIAFSKYMSFSLGFGEGEFDLYFSEAVSKLGAQTAYELFPYTSAFQIPVIPDYGGYDMPDKYAFAENGSSSDAPPITNKIASMNSNIPDDVIVMGKKIRNIMKETFTSFGNVLDENRGSNNWVVSGNRTETEFPIVANDMHLSWTTPSIWWQVSYHSEESGIDVWGFSFIGTPIITAGHNKNIAWGYTNVGGDVLDWYYFNERNDESEYYFNGSWKAYETVDEVIKIKGKEPHVHTVRITDLGPEIPGEDYEINGKSLFASWIGIKDYKTELGGKYAFKAVYGFNRASDYDEFKSAVYMWDGPAQNIVYGDKEGNIALWVMGVHPNRTLGIDGRLPINGSLDNTAWNGFIEPQYWPHTKNPDQGYIVSANQKSTGPNYPYYIGSYYAEGYRARRINYLLHEDDSITVNDIKTIQTDTLDTSAESFVPILNQAIVDNSGFGSDVTSWQEVSTELSTWDFFMDKEEKAPLIYQFFIKNFMKLTFNDEWTDAGLEGSFPQRKTLENLTINDPNSTWFDDTSTQNVESRDDIMLLALQTAIEEISDEFGAFSNWKYGNYHKNYFEHLIYLEALSSNKDPISGSSYTVNPSSGEPARHGASERAIYDVKDFANSVAALPGGQSGNPTSKHYHDLLYNYFLKWEYYPQYFYDEPSDFKTNVNVESTLILRRA